MLGADRAAPRDRRRRRCRRSTWRRPCRPGPPTRCSGSGGPPSGPRRSPARRASIAARRQQDPSLVVVRRWPLGAPDGRTCCASLRGEPLDGDAADGRPIVVLDRRAGRGRRAPSPSASARCVAEAATVGEYLSATTRARARASSPSVATSSPTGGRRSTPSTPCIADLAAFAGLWNESTVRGPAWRFGDIGRRIERALVVLGLVDVAASPPPATQPCAIDIDDVVDVSALEVLLAANESLVAYRRRHRSDVELGAGRRPAAARRRQPAVVRRRRCDRLAEHVAAVDWAEGRRGRRARWRRSLDGDDALDGVGAAARRRSSAFAALVVDDVVRHARQPDASCAAGCGDGRGERSRDRDGPVHYRVVAPHDVRLRRPMTDGYTVAYLLPRPTPQQVVERGRGRRRRPSPTSAPSTSTCSATGCCRSACTTPTTRSTLHAASEVVVEPRRRRRRRASRGRSVGATRRASCAAATRWPCGRSPAARRSCRSTRHGAALRAIAEEAFTPRPPDRRRRPGTLCHADPRDVRVRPVVHRRVDAAVGRARRRAAACARTSPTSPPAACARSASPRAT